MPPQTRIRLLLLAAPVAPVAGIWLGLWPAVLLGVLVAALGYLLLERAAGRETLRRSRQSGLAGSLALVRSDDEAADVLRRHLEHALAGSEVTVLAAEGEACLARRAGRAYETKAGAPPVACPVCAGGDAARTCVPVIARGKAVGSVLVRHTAPLAPEGLEELRASVVVAAPAFARLPDIAPAAHGKAPDDDVVRETLRRMVAQSSRTLKPLSVVVFALSTPRDEGVLAAVETAVTSAVRESDAAGRYDGDDFVLMLPATDTDGALLVIDKVRSALARLPVAGAPLTASFGLAVVPDDALEAGEVLRSAEAALLRARAEGRDTVEASELLVEAPLTQTRAPSGS